MTLPRLPTIVSATALCLALAAPAAIAQPYGQPYYANEGATVGGVTIFAPRRIGRSSIGAPIELVSESIVVPAGDLNLRTGWGMRVLRSRIQRAAYNACQDLEWRYPVSADGEGNDCYGVTVRRAYDQVAYRMGY